MSNIQEVLRNPFNVETHKATFIDYLEVVILEDGSIHYAVPSHAIFLIRYACKILDITKEQLENLMPLEVSLMEWLTEITKSVSVRNKFIIGKPNRIQKEVLKMLKEEGLYNG